MDQSSPRLDSGYEVRCHALPGDLLMGATIAFYLLGATVLHGRGIPVENDNLMVNLSNIYSTSFGDVGLWIFVVGAMAVLYSTVFVATASNSRLGVDFLNLLGILKCDTEEKRKTQSA